jgi:hypothetical protein
MANMGNKGPVYFLTEQACCLAQSSGRDTDEFRACRNATAYLAGGESDAISAFDRLTAAVKRDPDGNEDYDTESYSGKLIDLCAALIEMAKRAHRESTPETARQCLIEAAGIIAGFYDADSILDAVLDDAATA